MFVGLLNQLYIFRQLYLIELLRLLRGVGLLELLCYTWYIHGFWQGLACWSSSQTYVLMEFQVRYLALFHLFSVIDGFGWFWMGSLHINIQLMLEFLNAQFLVLCFSYYTSMIFLMMLSVILPSVVMILLSTLIVIRHLICGKT